MVRDYENAQQEEKNQAVESPTVVREGESVGRSSSVPAHRLALINGDEKSGDKNRVSAEKNCQHVVIHPSIQTILRNLDPERRAKLIAEYDKITAFEKDLKSKRLVMQNGLNESGVNLMPCINQSGRMKRDKPESKCPAVQPMEVQQGCSPGVQNPSRSIWARLCAGLSNCCAVLTRRSRQTPVDQP